jgi:hypothetical protein
MTTLSEVLETSSALPWKRALYLPGRPPWTLETKGAVLDPEEEPVVEGLCYVLGIAQVQEIVENARLQRPDATLPELLKAFHFYFGRDALIDFDKPV